MLREFYRVRSALESSRFSLESRRIEGSLQISQQILPDLEFLQSNGHLDQARDANGRSLSFLPDAAGIIQITIIPPEGYFENAADLLLYATEELEDYYVHGIGDIHRGDACSNQDIVDYRLMLRAKSLLRNTADLEDAKRAVFFSPEKLEIPFICEPSDLVPMPGLPELEAELARGAVEREQRLVLFKRSLGEHLKPHAVNQHFSFFLRNFTSIYETFSPDYQLWIGNTFGELEKSFEEKRLKFIADLTGILAGIQASILAVPIAAILLGDKYDPTNPLRNFLLAMGVTGLGTVSLMLLKNQEHTLDSTRNAIDSTKSDFEVKQNKRKAEFASRLTAIDQQEQRVRNLLFWMRISIKVIAAVAVIAWLGSFIYWASFHLNSKITASDQSSVQVQTSAPAAPSATLSASKASPTPAPTSTARILAVPTAK